MDIIQYFLAFAETVYVPLTLVHVVMNQIPLGKDIRPFVVVLGYQPWRSTSGGSELEW